MKYQFTVIAIMALTLIAGSRTPAQTPVSRTEQQRYLLAAEYSRQRHGLSVLVMKGNEIVFEDYENGHSVDEPWMLASGTKSFTGVMLAAAIEDKLINGFNEKVSDTITEWRSDKRKSSITLRQLLSLTSGLNSGQIGLVPSYKDALDFMAEYEPGTRFQYGPVPFQIFGEVMTRKLRSTGETVMQYLNRRVINPIGLKVAFWRMENGQPLLPQGAFLTAREWAKFGLFLKNGGKWNGKQVIARKLLDELVVGSATNPAYGVSFWLNHEGKNAVGISTGLRLIGEISKNGIADGVKDLFMAAGAGNQRLYVIPSFDLVVVRQGRVGLYDDREFLRRLLIGEIEQ